MDIEITVEVEGEISVTAEIDATVITAGTVNIIDQDGNLIAQPAAGTDYEVLVFSEILDGTPGNIPVDEIVDNPF